MSFTQISNPAPFNIGRTCTHIDKGGEYVVEGISFGTGKFRKQRLVIYAKAGTGQLFHRAEADFLEKMKFTS